MRYDRGSLRHLLAVAAEMAASGSAYYRPADAFPLSRMRKRANGVKCKYRNARLKAWRGGGVAVSSDARKSIVLIVHKCKRVKFTTARRRYLAVTVAIDGSAIYDKASMENKSMAKSKIGLYYNGIRHTIVADNRARHFCNGACHVT